MIQPPIAILKCLWSRHPDGLWQIADLKSLSLKPTQGCETDYFTIESDFELMTQNPQGMSAQQLLASFGTTEFLLKQSILPVVAWCKGETCIRTIGTASVISCTGYVLTAAHVLMDPYEGGYGARRQGYRLEYAEELNFGVLIPISPATGIRGVIFCPFERMWLWGRWKESPLFHEQPRFDCITDVAICKIPELPDGVAHQPLNMSLNPFVKDEAAYSIGYAEMASITFQQINEFAPDLYVSIGPVVEVFPQNSTDRRRPSTPGPCFEFGAKIPGKMSGAPIFGSQGAIIRGVVSTSFGEHRTAHGSMLGPAMDLPLDRGRTLRSLMDDGNEGITQVLGSGL